MTFREDDGTLVVYDERTESNCRYRHDERGRPTFIEHPDGTREEYEHDDRGLLVVGIDRQGGRTRYVHDEQGNAVQVFLANGATEENEFDYLGRRTAHVDLAGNRTEFRWDRRNEVIEKIHADGSRVRVVRDALRKPLLIDEGGRVTELEYGGIGWLKTIRWPGGETHELRYDVEGNLTLVRNSRGQEFRQSYNVASKCIAYSHFEDVPFEMGYDVAGNPTYVSGPLSRVAFEHDENHDLVGVAAPDVEGSFAYGTGGFAALLTNAAPVQTTFDALGRITQQQQGKHRVDVGWVGGQLAAISSSVGLPVTYERRACAEVAAITVGSIRIRHDEESGADLLSYVGNSLVHRRTFNAVGRMIRQSIARYDRDVSADVAATRDDPRLLYWIAYEYDAGQMLRREWRSDGTRVEYELDRGDRIVNRRTTKDGIEREDRLVYDVAGSPQMPNATYDRDGRPLSLGEETFAYDAHSRLVQRTTPNGEWNYEWNALDQLVRVVAPEHVVEMDYDLVGRRMRKRVFRQDELVSSRSYVYANHLLLHEVDDLTGASRTYVSTNDSWETIGHVDLVNGIEVPCLYIRDPAGALDFAVAADGEVAWSATSSVFGERTVHTAKTDVTLRFANQFWDRDVELVYNRYRWYDPRLGLYITPDPWLLRGTLNPRDYVPNPTAFIDPAGLASKKHHGVGSGKESAKFHASPPNPVAPHPGSVNGLGANQMSEPGHWARNIAPGTPGHTPGFANCPPDALHSADKSGFQQCIPENGGKSAQEIVDKAGEKYGCHTCGAKNSGYPDNADGTPHWTCDHQPPRCTYSEKNAKKAGNHSSHDKASRNSVRLYPMCKACSGRQAGKVGALGGPPKKIAKGNEEMKKNKLGPKRK